MVSVIAVARGVVFGDDAARLHVVGDDAVVDDRDARHPRGRRKRRLGVVALAAGDLEGDVGAEFRPDQRRAGFQRLLHVDHRRQRLVVDLDRLGRGLRRFEIVGDDEGDRIADMAHGVPGEQRTRRRLLVGAVGLAQLRLARQAADAVEIGMGEDQPHAGHGGDLREVAEPEAGVGHGRAQHVGAQRPLRRDVVDDSGRGR